MSLFKMEGLFLDEENPCCMDCRSTNIKLLHWKYGNSHLVLCEDCNQKSVEDLLEVEERWNSDHQCWKVIVSNDGDTVCVNSGPHKCND